MPEEESLKFDPKNVEAVVFSAANTDVACKFLLKDSQTNALIWQSGSKEQCDKPIPGLTKAEFQNIDGKLSWVFTKD